MKKVLRLFSIQIWGILGNMLAIGEKKKKKTRALYVGFIVFAISMSLISFFYSYMTGMGLKMFGGLDLLPSLFMTLTSLIVIFTTVYNVKGTLFGFKDYDMVMSLPVSNSQIVASRILLLYSINIVFVLIIMIPMMIAYGILGSPGIQFYIFSILLLFFIPLIPIIIASILGTALTYLSMRFRYSNIVYMVFSFLLLIGFIIMPFFMGDSEEALVEMTQSINEQINNIYPLSPLYSKAVTKGDIWSLIIFIVITVLAFMTFSMVVGRLFKLINSVIMTGRYKTHYKMKALESSSPLKALYKKDFKRLFSSAIYVMNTGFGVVMIVLGALALPFIDMNSLAEGMDITGAIQDLIPIIITFCIATSCTTMASISIEGKNIWIVKSLPIPTLRIFKSKILVNLTILAPALLAAVLICFTMKLPFLEGMLTVLSAATFSVCVSLYGLVINLSFPNLSWTNEAVIVKQSTSSMISIFSGMGMAAIQYVLVMVMGDFIKGMLIFIIALCILILLLYKRLSKTGCRQFERL